MFLAVAETAPPFSEQPSNLFPKKGFKKKKFGCSAEGRSRPGVCQRKRKKAWMLRNRFAITEQI
jgi:hypothetical protein